MPTLEWIGKKAVINHHRQVPYHLLRCNEKLSVGDPGSGNLLVEGDNLLALKALLPYYAGQVKCIYIDPPYNTGNENWVYNDAVNSPEIRRWLGKVVGGEAEDLSRHDKWLCMMYPRLALLREFLREDGALFVEIDDNETAYLQALLDDLFGRHNRVLAIAIKRSAATGHKAINPTPVNVTEYIQIYAKDRWRWKYNPTKVMRRDYDSAYCVRLINPGDHYSLWRFEPLAKHVAIISGYNSSKEARKGLGKKKFDENLVAYALSHPEEVVRYAQPNYRGVSQAARDLIDQSKDNSALVLHLRREGYSDMYFKGGNRILFLKDKVQGEGSEAGLVEPLTNWWDDIPWQGIAREGGVQFQKSKKPEKIVRRVLEMCTEPGDLVLDSFAGSGTTGAVAQYMGRRWILVEMEPDICQSVTIKRLTTTIEGHKANGKRVEGLGGGFRYCTLAQPLFDESGTIRSEVTFADLAAHVFFTETGEPIPKRTNGRTPLIGVCKGTAYYLLFNGVLGDKTPNGGNVLTAKVLAKLPAHDGPKVVYGEGCRLAAARLKRNNIVFKQVPYEVKTA